MNGTPLKVLFSSRLDFVDHDMGSIIFVPWLGSSDYGAASSFLVGACGRRLE